MAKGKIRTEKTVRDVLHGIGNVKVFVPRRGERVLIDVQLEKPQLILPRVTELKKRLNSFKLNTYWRGKIQGVGSVSVQLVYPHSNKPLRIIPKYFVELPYFLSNGPSPHEVKGKYYIVHTEHLEHPHDNILVQLSIRANSTITRHTTDLDLIGLKKGRVLLAEVLNGRTTDIRAALLRKSEVWSALKSIGIPIEEIVVYVAVRVPSIFKRNYLAKTLEILREKGFSGTLWLTNMTHSKHEEFAF